MSYIKDSQNGTHKIIHKMKLTKVIHKNDTYRNDAQNETHENDIQKWLTTIIKNMIQKYNSQNDSLDIRINQQTFIQKLTFTKLCSTWTSQSDSQDDTQKWLTKINDSQKWLSKMTHTNDT